MGELNVVRVGSGAGYSGDRIDPAVDLARRARLNYLVFECLGERTMATAQLARRNDPASGYDLLLDARMRAVLPLTAGRTTIVTNMGAANPTAAAQRTAQLAGQLGLHGLRVACVTGHDVQHLLTDDAASDRQRSAILSADAYLGADAVLAALRQRPDVVITGRVADAALFLAPLRHEFGWPDDAWDLLAAGTVLGHLLECAGQLTGGYFADPETDPMPNLAHLGFPFADAHADGTIQLGMLPDVGGQLDRLTTTAQLLYEVDDPSAYLTPDVTVDLTGVQIEELGPRRVRVSGARGRHRPDTLKALIGRRGGYLGEGQISYRGPGARQRAELAGEVVGTRLREVHDLPLRNLRTSLIGCADEPHADPPEVRLRVAATTDTADQAELIGHEVETLYTNGPAGGGGATRSHKPILDLEPVLVDRDTVCPDVHLYQARAD